MRILFVFVLLAAIFATGCGQKCCHCTDGCGCHVCKCEEGSRCCDGCKCEK